MTQNSSKNIDQTITAAVFPGQGTQFSGMGRDFYETFPASRQTFEEASQALGWDVAGLCFEDDQKLNLTEYAQPCILTTEIAMFRALQNEFGFQPDLFGGHSLGEYAGLVAADVMPFARAVSAVKSRGELMQKATPKGMGGMAAVISKKLDRTVLSKLIEDIPVDIANINSASQIVVSGETAGLRSLKDRLKESAGDSRPPEFIPLNVSAPFHSRFMSPVEKEFREILNSFAHELVLENASRVTSNYTGDFHFADSNSVINSLVYQISKPVNWLANMKTLLKKAQKIYEIGPKRPLRGFFFGMDVKCLSITSLASAKRACAAE